MNEPKESTSAVVISGLPNLNDYVYRHRDQLMEERCKEEFSLATEMSSKDLGFGQAEKRDSEQQ
jgi:hypothetical protein